MQSHHYNNSCSPSYNDGQSAILKGASGSQESSPEESIQLPPFYWQRGSPLPHSPWSSNIHPISSWWDSTFFGWIRDEGNILWNMVTISLLTIKQTSLKRKWLEEANDNLPQVCKLAFNFHDRILRIHCGKTPHWPKLGGNLTNIGRAKSVPDIRLDKRCCLLPPFEIDTVAEKSFTLKFEGTIRGLRHELKDSLVKQADAIEGMRGEVKDLTEAIQGLRANVKDLLGKQMEVLLTMLEVMKDSNTKAGSRSILILWKVECSYGYSHGMYIACRILFRYGLLLCQCTVYLHNRRCWACESLQEWSLNRRPSLFWVTPPHSRWHHWLAIWLTSVCLLSQWASVSTMHLL